MARTASEDLDKIPVWAKKRIQRLELDKKNLEERLANRDAFILAQHPGTNVFQNSGIADDRPLVKNAHISFRFSDRWDDAINIHHDGPNRLYVASLSGGLAVLPQSGNVVRLSRFR